jgi:hypothetical protein
MGFFHNEDFRVFYFSPGNPGFSMEVVFDHTK